MKKKRPLSIKPSKALQINHLQGFGILKKGKNNA
jgi:hypothetical protein